MSLFYETCVCVKLNFSLIAFVGVFEIPSLTLSYYNTTGCLHRAQPQNPQRGPCWARSAQNYFEWISFQNGLPWAPSQMGG